jgi:hypothetical protein
MRVANEYYPTHIYPNPRSRTLLESVLVALVRPIHSTWYFSDNSAKIQLFEVSRIASLWLLNFSFVY